MGERFSIRRGAIPVQRHQDSTNTEGRQFYAEGRVAECSARPLLLK